MFEIIFILIKFSICNILLFGSCLLLIHLIYLKNKRNKEKIYSKVKIISFVHPFCSDCGGGEKVLWRMLISLIKSTNNQSTQQVIKINILAGVKETAEEINQKLKNRFDIDFTKIKSSSYVSEIEIIRLKTAHLLKPKSFATMLLQILGQIFFAFEIICKCYSDVYVDTTGLPFTYFILSLLGHAKVSAYVHYPFISLDMIRDVEKNISGVHSRGIMSKVGFLKQFKIYYYKLILFLYKVSGSFISYAQCNSSWTYNHMKPLWLTTKLDMLYPPCSTHIYEKCFKNKNRDNVIVSFAQFRPEKNHRMQIRIMKKLRERKGMNDVKLHIIGAVRDENDHIFFNELQQEVNSMGLTNVVKLIPNAPFEDVINEFAKAKIGIHTMRDEHFGISIIEMMAAGLVVITHNSAGAKNDIIGPSTQTVGVLVEDEDDYVDNIAKILQNHAQIDYIPQNALVRAKLFSDESFEQHFSEKAIQMFN